MRINVANTEYQIFDWEAPEFGVAEKFRVTVQRKHNVLFKLEVEGTETSAMSQVSRCAIVRQNSKS